MFDKAGLGRDGVQAQALVLDKKSYAVGAETRAVSACRYELRVKFEDGSTAEISHRAFGRTVASAEIGDLIPVRYDPADRSKVEIDRHAIAAQQTQEARDLEAQAIARGERALGQSPAETPAASFDDQQVPDTGDLRVGDADRDLIASVLEQHMAEGRLSTDELDDRLGVLYRSQTRAQAKSVLAGLPLLAAVDHVADLPDWARAPSPSSTQPRRPSGAVAGGLPTDEEMTAAHHAWRAKVTQVKADKKAHKSAEATGDRKETFLAFRKLVITRAEEKSARAKFEDLRKRRPDWTAGAAEQ